MLPSGVEIGWRWNIKQGVNPAHDRQAFYARFIDGNYHNGDICYIDTAPHYYTVRYMYDEPGGKYRWYWFIDGKLKKSFGDLRINEGWAYGGCERGFTGDTSWPDTNYGYFWNMQVWAYYPQGYWTWIFWTQPRDWPFFAYLDPDFKFYPYPDQNYPKHEMVCDTKPPWK